MSRTRKTIGEVQLTTREVDILETAARGLSSDETSRELGLTVGTVHTYKKRIYKKLGVTSLLAAVNLWTNRRTTKLNDRMEQEAQALLELARAHLDNVGLGRSSVGAVLERAAELAASSSGRKAS